MESCPHCAAPLETPLGCGKCGAALPLGSALCAFEVFQLQPSMDVDQKSLRKRLVRFSRLVHPDFFTSSDAESRALAEHNSAELNAAFGILSNDFRRADYLLKLLSGPTEKDERQMPQEFLMEVMEWNELLERAREQGSGSKARESLSRLHITLQGERHELFEAIHDLLTPLPEPASTSLTEVRRRLNAVRYIDRALAEIEALRLDQAAAG